MATKSMHIRPFAKGDEADIFRVLTANGWAHRVPSVEYLAKLISASQRVMVAVEDHHLVAFARAITDGMSNGYLSMVVVDKPFRGKGIGTALVEAIAGAEPHVTWVLRAGRPGAQDFFRKVGFETSTESMVRPRQLPSTQGLLATTDR